MFITKAADGDALDSTFNNSNDNASLAWSIALTNGLFIPVVTCFVGGRLFTRAFMTKQLFADDYIMLSAAFFFLLQCAINLAAMSAGFGDHVWNVPGRIDGTQMVQQMNFASLILLSISLCLAKLSIITALLHIFTPQTVKILRNLLLATGFVVVIFCVVQFFLIVFQCHPVYLSWDVSEIGRKGTCMSFEAATFGAGIVNLITNVIITVAPVRYFLGLNMPLRRKLCLCGLFLTGVIACIISFVRLVAIKGVQNNFDVTYGSVGYFNWSVAETGLCIITGSVPPLRPLMATILPDFFKAAGLASMAMPMKDGMRRPSSSPVSSRRSSADITYPAPSLRCMSDTTAMTTPVTTKDHDLRGSARQQTTPEPKPFQLGERVAEALRPWSPTPLTMAAKQGLSKLGDRFHRSGSSNETGRRLSVINSLDDSIDAHKTAPGAVGRTGFEYIMTKLWALSTRVQNANWKLSSWRFSRSRGTSDSPVANPGSIIVIKHVETKSDMVGFPV